MTLLQGLRRVAEAQSAESGTLEPLMDIIESYFSAKYPGSSAKSNWDEKYVSRWTEGALDPAKDFLGLAATCGPYLDLSERFLRHVQRADPPRTSYLLSCAVIDHLRPIRWEVVLILLLNGADPHEKTRVKYSKSLVSCWNRFLCGIDPTSGQYGMPSTTIMYETIEAFLNNGADLHENVRITYYNHLACTYLRYRDKKIVELRCELSARYVVTEILRHDPRFSIIEERFESAGARASRRLLSACHRDSDLAQWQPIPEQDFQYVLEALDEALKKLMDINEF